jgi:hypothetical protein
MPVSSFGSCGFCAPFRAGALRRIGELAFGFGVSLEYLENAPLARVNFWYRLALEFGERRAEELEDVRLSREAQITEAVRLLPRR